MNATVSSHRRHAWVDYAKGICIVAVATLYATEDLQREMIRHGMLPELARGWLDAWVAFARPFRMPDFFLLSGLFLSRVIDRPWRSYLDKRVAHYLYFFLLWTLIFFVFRSILGLTGDDAGTVLRNLLLMLIEPFAMLWFIQMLALYFVVTRLTRKVPKWLMFALAAGLQIYGIESEWAQLRHFAERYVYFYAGYAFAPIFFALADLARSHRRRALLALLVWALINGTLVELGFAATDGVSLLLGFAGAVAVIAVARLLCDLPWMDWLRYLGEHSIVVYLGFYLPMSALTMLLASRGWIGDPGTTAALVTAFSIACAVALERQTRGNAARFLFVRPAWARLERATVPPRGVAEQGTVG